jgi:hypothetical protein
VEIGTADTRRPHLDPYTLATWRENIDDLDLIVTAADCAHCDFLFD